MATFSFGAGTSNYNGEVLEDLLTYTAQENETYKEGLIHIKSGIQKKYTLPSIQLGTIIQDRKATPLSPNFSAATPTVDATRMGLSIDSLGTYELAERYLEPEDFMIYIEFNPRDFEDYYKPFQPTGTLVFRELDPKVQAVMLRLLMERKNQYINHAIWCAAKDASKYTGTAPSSGSAAAEIGANDVAGPMKYFDGAIARILQNAVAASGTEDARSGKVVVTGSTLFADGQAVEAELFAMHEATPKQIRKNPGLVYLMDYKSWDAYSKYISAKTYKYTDNTQENQFRFRGKRIIPMVALPDDTIILGNFTSGVDSNLWMGVDYADAENVVQIDKLQNNSELYFFKALFKMDVNIVKPSEIVAHVPYTYAP